MQKKIRVILLLLVFVLVLGGAYAAYHKLSPRLESPSPAAPVEAAESFVDFTVYDADGNPVALSSLLGKPVLVNYWATWCPYCVQEFPAMQEAYEAFGDRVNFVMVNITDGVRETVQTASDFIAENGYTFPVYFDSAESACDAYGVYSYPTTLFLAADGTRIYQFPGALQYESIENGLNTVLNWENQE